MIKLSIDTLRTSRMLLAVMNSLRSRVGRSGVSRIHVRSRSVAMYGRFPAVGMLLRYTPGHTIPNAPGGSSSSAMPHKCAECFALLWLARKTMWLRTPLAILAATAALAGAQGRIDSRHMMNVMQSFDAALSSIRARGAYLPAAAHVSPVR